MHAQGFTRGEILDDEFTAELEPRGSHATDFLQEEAIAAEDAGAE